MANPTRAAVLRFLPLIAALALFAVLICCSPDERLTLRISTWSAPEEVEIMDRCIKAFERRYPQIRVVHEAYPSGYLDKILTSMAADAPPDVILLDSIHIPTFVEGDVLIDLQPYAERVDIDLNKFYPAVLEIGRVGSKLYAFPKDFTPMAYFYNRAIFDATGTPYPADDWTWEDFLATCVSLTGDDDGDGRLDHWGTNLDRELYRWQPWIWAAGGDIVSPDGSTAIGYFDSPRCSADVHLHDRSGDQVRRHASLRVDQGIGQRLRPAAENVLQRAPRPDGERPLVDTEAA